MSSDASSEHDASIEGYVQRAQLLADLGRYDEAVAELGAAVTLGPGNPAVLITLARVHLVAGRPAEALAAAEAAVTAAPRSAAALVARGLALVDLGRFREAAMTADEVLALGPDDAYAQRSGAALLAESRNGQPALDAAWRGVQLAPTEPEAHLVLTLVAARLQLFDLAERAYREALEIAPDIADAAREPGVVRLERRRYAAALEEAAESIAPPPVRFEQPRRGGDALVAPGPADGDLRRLLLYGAGFAIVAAVVVAAIAVVDSGASRVLAAALALTGVVAGWVLAARLRGPLRAVLPPLLRADRRVALGVYGVAAALGLLLLYTVIGSVWPLVAAIAAAAIAELAVLRPPAEHR